MRRLAIGVALVVVTSVLGGCAPSTGGGSCAWAYQPDPTATPAFPDTSATYYQLPYALGPGQSIVLDGTVPNVRYFSFTTYGTDGAVIDGLADPELPTDAGRYALRVAATPDGSADSAVLSAGAGPIAAGILVMRVYLPVGGPPTLPDVALRQADGSTTVIPRCAPNSGAGTAALTEAAIALSAPVPAPPSPTFTRQSGAGLFPNPDNAYLAALTSWQPGRVIVVTGRAPTFPDTSAGSPRTAPADVRYWSMCTNTDVIPFPVVACAADQDTTLDANGRYTYVVSTPQDRPPSTAANGVTWLPWGPTTTTGVLIYRNMLPSPSFTASVQQVPIGATPLSAMGDYAPHAKYCTTTSFAANGSAC